MQPVIERAIFTSTRSGRMNGYQLAGASGGIGENDRRELSRWGPAHDSLLDAGIGGASVNFHQLPSGLHCVSRTVHAGAEYSGRGGFRVYTHMLLAPAEALVRFSNNPFRLLDAATAAGHLKILDPIPERLEPIRLLGSATPVDCILLARLAIYPGPRAVGALVDAALGHEQLAVGSRLPLVRLVAGLMSLLPVELRPLFSFSTGLKPSKQRAFRVQPLERAAAPGAARRPGDPLPLLLDDVRSSHSLNSAWAKLVDRVLTVGTTSQLCRALRQPRPDLKQEGLDMLAQRLLGSVAARTARSADPQAEAVPVG